jgi:hypothetical protein
MIARSAAIIPLTPSADHTDKEGYFVLASGALVSSATSTLPLGIITEGAKTTGKDAVALPNFGGTVKAKVTGSSPGSIVFGSSLVLTADGSVKLDPGTGSRIRVAIALESGAANELIEVALVPPAILS